MINIKLPFTCKQGWGILFGASLLPNIAFLFPIHKFVFALIITLDIFIGVSLFAVFLIWFWDHVEIGCKCND